MASVSHLVSHLASQLRSQSPESANQPFRHSVCQSVSQSSKLVSTHSLFQTVTHHYRSVIASNVQLGTKFSQAVTKNRSRCSSVTQKVSYKCSHQSLSVSESITHLLSQSFSKPVNQSAFDHIQSFSQLLGHSAAKFS